MPCSFLILSESMQNISKVLSSSLALFWLKLWCSTIFHMNDTGIVYVFANCMEVFSRYVMVELHSSYYRFLSCFFGTFWFRSWWWSGKSLLSTRFSFLHEWSSLCWQFLLANDGFSRDAALALAWPIMIWSGTGSGGTYPSVVQFRLRMRMDMSDVQWRINMSSWFCYLGFGPGFGPEWLTGRGWFCYRGSRPGFWTRMVNG